MRKSRARALRRQRWGKVASIFGVAPSPKQPAQGKGGEGPGREEVAVAVPTAPPVAWPKSGEGSVAPVLAAPVLAAAVIAPADLEALERGRDESRRASRRAAVFISLIVHVLVVVGLFSVVLPSRLDPPQMIVALPEKEQVDPDEMRKRREENLSAAPMPKAAISLPKMLANLPSPVAAPVVEILSDETLAQAAMPTTGIGRASGRMNFGASLKGSAIGGLMIRSKKLGVVLDSSPSMTAFLPALRTEIRRNFRGSVFREIKGCTLRATNGRDNSAIVTFYDPIAVMMGIKVLVQEHKVDAIYWFCDLQDPQTDEALDELEKLLGGSFPGHKVRFYVRSVDRRASSRLKSIIDRSGGKIEVGPVN